MDAVAASPKCVLITLPGSHFVEKARWALDIAGVPFLEEPHAPGSHRKHTGGGSVPVLVLPDGSRLTESTEIVRHCHQLAPSLSLWPADTAHAAEVDSLVLELDALGEVSRVVAYWHIFNHSNRAVQIAQLTNGVPESEARLVWWILPMLRMIMCRGMNITAHGYANALAEVRRIFTSLEGRLAPAPAEADSSPRSSTDTAQRAAVVAAAPAGGRGRSYLVGGSFTAADLTFAALAYPVLLPPQFGGGYPKLDYAPEFHAVVEQFRATVAGQHAMRMYAEHRGGRPPSSDQAAAVPGRSSAQPPT